jgi:chaperonin GroES
MRKIRPLHERVIIKEQEIADRTEGGIWIPEESKEVPTEGTVVSVGNLVNKEGEDIKPGDTIMYMKYGGLPINIMGEKYRMLMKNDIIAVIEDVENTTEGCGCECDCN